MADNWFHILLEIDKAGEFSSDTLRFWSGLQDLRFEGVSWLGMGSIMSADGIESSIGAPNNTLTVGISSLHPTVRTHFMHPIGHKPATLRFIRSQNGGKTWTLLPVQRFGFTSSPRLQGGVYLVDIVHPFEIAFRRRAAQWSDEDQRRRYSNDNGMSQMRDVAEGVNIRFPFLRHS